MDLTFTTGQTNMLIGCLLGNANLYTQSESSGFARKGFTWRARFFHKAVHLPYAEHKYQILKDFCIQKPTLSSFLDKRTKETYERYYFNTKISNEFTFLANLFYKKENDIWKKRLPKNISHYLNAETIAYWYMDDGALIWQGRSNAVRLCTDSFSDSEVALLKKSLEEKFSLKCSIQKKNGISRISILEESYPKLKALILPYLLPCMFYKFPDGNNGVMNNEDILEDIRNTFRERERFEFEEK